MINHKAIGEYRYLNDGADDGAGGAGVSDLEEAKVIRSGSDIDYKTDVITDCTVVDYGSGWRDGSLLRDGISGGKVWRNGERAVAGTCGTMIAMLSLALVGLTLLIIIIKICNDGEK